MVEFSSSRKSKSSNGFQFPFNYLRRLGAGHWAGNGRDWIDCKGTIEFISTKGHEMATGHKEQVHHLNFEYPCYISFILKISLSTHGSRQSVKHSRSVAVEYSTDEHYFHSYYQRRNLKTNLFREIFNVIFYFYLL